MVQEENKKHWICVILLGMLVSSFAVTTDAHAGEATIYVIREADGAMRFTNKPPRKGQSAQVFTSSGRGGRFYRASSYSDAVGHKNWKEDPRASMRFSSLGPRKLIPGRRGRLFLDRYSREIERASYEHDVDPALVRAVIHAESSFNPYAVSPKGARGLMQLMPSTARMLGVRNSFSPESNIRGGTKYLSQLLKRFPNEAHAIAAYNAGSVPVTKYKGVPPYAETREYVKRVLSLKKQYTEQLHG